MPRRNDIHRILLIGSGPIVIGQGAEFDYSGTQAAKALREEGYEVILVNSNPATIMTDPEVADRTYIEPVTPEYVELIIEREKPDALLPTMGGQTALNVAMALHERGVLEKHGVELIGANARAIAVAEDRKLFAEAMAEIGLKCPEGKIATTWEEALEIAEWTGFPAIIRPAFTLGGSGGGIAYNRDEYERIVRRGLDESPISQVLIERSLLGWKEYELEVMRDAQDNVVIICSIENLDPMGIHTGDSITCAPAMTLSDREYQVMRDAAMKVIRKIGVAAGGCNIQFAVNPANGEMVVIEMNPRVSRSSALASKATGFAIARIGTKLAVGYSLDEIPNDITKTTPASFEPVLDYVVVKVPRFAFEKFPGANTTLTTQMKSVGESMAMGRTFKEAFQKALRALETGRAGWVVGERPVDDRVADDSIDAVRAALPVPVPERMFQIKRAMLLGMSLEEIRQRTMMDPWFLEQFAEMLEAEKAYAAAPTVDARLVRRMKRMGFSDRQLAALRKETEQQARERRWALGVRPAYKMVDTCAGEFPSNTPYLYSSYDEESEAPRTGKKSVIILGSGPNRIGQGVEFDYCCVRAALALREAGYETIMVNSNPETVSTDYDTSDKLYFEPLTFEDVLEIVDREQPVGVIVQLGGQTPLKLVKPLEAAGVKILGTSPEAIDIAEDRKRFEQLARELGVQQPPNGTATSVEEAVKIAERIGYPVLLRPSYVLGGRAMEIVYDEPSLRDYFQRAVRVSEDRPVLVDAFLEDAFEADVDALSDGETVVIGGVMEHIEDAGIHSGDSACALPPYLISQEHQDQMRAHTVAFAKALGVVGLINVQYALKDGVVYVLEVNPRASRTVPFVSKTIGKPLASLAARVMLGETLEQLGYTEEIVAPFVSVKEAVFPFTKFREFDPILGPEMRSTGEVMGVSETFGMAYAKAEISAGNPLPREGTVMLTVNDRDKAKASKIAARFATLGFGLVATEGTAKHLAGRGIEARSVFKVSGGRPNGIDLMVNGELQLLINTPLGKRAQKDDYSLRQAAVANRVPYTTTLSGASAACEAIETMRTTKAAVKSLQEWQAMVGVEPA
ncbi:carbamoyl-phosphate synthase large subunit [Pseudogemmatithrix spongiicola]|uniref:Carbamoyl phosphate synthase large chain n=1 Tax=Pseudogemmatithrix spongiicola TaxID=3062599 RepID=A0AA49JVT3_9BACT|nr:carbamoyl-phosphate synthase large subunit [Gemmatimonadaceae bacterium 'strain 138']WKW15450.1 carbamoyl-phosphate synthase large subunit [Gemmatimonadaceae bacterium 'strain 318']